ncbi:MAG: hypothetical protein ACOZQL_07435 [Myxococcota bacterium]
MRKAVGGGVLTLAYAAAVARSRELPTSDWRFGCLRGVVALKDTRCDAQARCRERTVTLQWTHSEGTLTLSDERGATETRPVRGFELTRLEEALSPALASLPSDAPQACDTQPWFGRPCDPRHVRILTSACGGSTTLDDGPALHRRLTDTYRRCGLMGCSWRDYLDAAAPTRRAELRPRLRAAPRRGAPVTRQALPVSGAWRRGGPDGR